MAQYFLFLSSQAIPFLGVGPGYRVINQPNMTWRVQAGPGARSIREQNGTDSTEIAGICAAADQVFERFLTLPTLPWMRGTLTLLWLDRLGDALSDAAAMAPLGDIDHTVVLPWLSPETSDLCTLRKAYHNLLGVCAELGMIQGRGVMRRRAGTV